MRWVVNGLDVTKRVSVATHSGSKVRCARELALTIAAPGGGGGLEPLNLPLFAPVEGYDDQDRRFFLGQVVQRQKDSDSNVMELEAMDRGYQLSNNEGWYAFRDVTPEGAVAVLAADFGFPLGEVAATGVKVSRKFPGVALHKIVDTLYTLASRTTGERYQIRFDGEALTVKSKQTTPAASIAPKVDLQRAAITEDATACRNSVAIYSETGALIRTLDRAEDQKLAGLLQAAVTQKDGEDAYTEAEKILEEGEVQQTVTVECLGDLRLVTGAAVMVQETTSGVSGLFWVDADVHTWKNGQYFCRLTLNFKNLMNETQAGGAL